jgi:hypothetical protein
VIRRDLSELAFKRPSAGRREGEEKEQQNTHVEALRDLFTDAGSNPAGSIEKPEDLKSPGFLVFASVLTPRAFAQRRQLPPARPFRLGFASGGQRPNTAHPPFASRSLP